MISSQTSTRKYKNRRIYKPPPAQNSSSNYKKLIIVIIISFVFITGQFVGGYISGSISVISDAFHLVTDLLGFVVSFIFLWFAKKKPNEKMSFGYHRMEVMGALGNLFIIWALAIFLIYQATGRIIEKEFVKEPLVMLIVAAVGLPINIVMYFVLHAGSSHSHGLMSEPCGQEYPVESENQNDNILCTEMVCEDIECLINHEYQEHCHKKQGEQEQIHKHQIKVVVEGDKVMRKMSLDDGKPKTAHEHGSNCKHDHGGHDHKHEGHDHKHDHQHDHKHDHKHEHTHENGKKCTHDHSKQKKETGMQSNSRINADDLHGHNHHDHSSHAGHDHSGHDHHHTHESLSMKAAILHALSDVIQSIGLIISSLIIFFAGSDKGKEVTEWNNWHYCDPITTYIFSIIVLVSTWPVLKNCYFIIMQSTPTYINTQQLQEQITKLQGVIDVHDLHIWDLRPGKTILIAHVFSKTGQEREVLKKLTDISRKKRIYHSTFQVQEELLRHNEEYILCDHDIH